MVEYTLKRWNDGPDHVGWEYITISGTDASVTPVVENLLVPGGWSIYLLRGSNR